MLLYHGSSVSGLTQLKPFLSEHQKPYVYLSSNPVVALLYAVWNTGDGSLCSTSNQRIGVNQACNHSKINRAHRTVPCA